MKNLRRVSSFIAVAALAGTIHAAEGVTVSVSKIKDLNLRVYGFVETDIITDSTIGLNEEAANNPITRRTDTTKSPVPDMFNGTHHRTQMSVRNSRLGFDLTLPKMDSGLQSEGVIELDFLGNNAANTQPGNTAFPVQSERDFFNNPAVRVRHAYLNLTYNAWNLKVGQYWSLLGWQPYYFPGEAIVQPGVGQLYRRFAQARVTRTDGIGDAWTFESALDVAKPAQINSALPEWHGGLRLASTKVKGASIGGAGTSMVGLSAAVSGALIPVRTDNGNDTGQAYAFDVFIPIIPSSDGKDRSNTLVLVGEIMSGSGVGGLEYSGLSLGVPGVKGTEIGMTGATGNTVVDSGIAGTNLDGNVELIRYRAFRTNMQYSLPGGRWSFSTGYAQVEGRNLDRFSPTIMPAAGAGSGAGLTAAKQLAQTNGLIPKIQFGYVSVFYDPLAWLRIAGEWNHTVDVYNDPGNRNAINNRFQLSTYFVF